VTRRARQSRWSAVAVAIAGLLGAGCVEWLEVDGDDDEQAAALEREALRAEAPKPPQRGAEAAGEGPLVPLTPGLRVPVGVGYWARVRLEALDVAFDTALITLNRLEDRLVLRLFAAPDDDPDAPSLHLVTELPLAPASAIEDLAGLDLFPRPGATTAVFRTSSRDLWVVTPSRLTFDSLGDEVIVGSLEGIATRGLDGQRSRRIEVGFVALRAPSRAF
jgi:hypothetical protein